MIFPKTLKLTETQLRELLQIVGKHGCALEEAALQTRSIYLIKNGINGIKNDALFNELSTLPYISRVGEMEIPYRLMDRHSTLANHQVGIGNLVLGKDPCFIAGVCTIDVKNPQLFLETAVAIKECGGHVLRGGVWKPRTRLYSYQGEDKALDILLEAKRLTGLPINTEVLNSAQLSLALDAGVDVIQVGTRNALNYSLLQEIGQQTAKTKVVVLLKKSRAMASVDEFLAAGEYVVAQGNPNLMLCLRGTLPRPNGFRSFPDESMTLLLKEKTWAPVIVDPSHSTGQSSFVPSSALAAMCYGADGIMMEVHLDPKRGLGDDPHQAITPDVVKRIIKDCQTLWTLRKKY